MSVVSRQFHLLRYLKISANGLDLMLPSIDESTVKTLYMFNNTYLMFGDVPMHSNTLFRKFTNIQTYSDVKQCPDMIKDVVPQATVTHIDVTGYPRASSFFNNGKYVGQCNPTTQAQKLIQAQSVQSSKQQLQTTIENTIQTAIASMNNVNVVNLQQDNLNDYVKETEKINSPFDALVSLISFRELFERYRVAYVNETDKLPHYVKDLLTHGKDNLNTYVNAYGDNSLDYEEEIKEELKTAMIELNSQRDQFYSDVINRQDRVQAPSSEEPSPEEVTMQGVSDTGFYIGTLGL